MFELKGCVCGIATRNAAASADSCKPEQRIKDLQISPRISNVAHHTKGMWIEPAYIVVRVQTDAVPCLESMCLKSTDELSHFPSRHTSGDEVRRILSIDIDLAQSNQSAHSCATSSNFVITGLSNA